jgi:transcriptional regulator with XRE-family HTH domain
MSNDEIFHTLARYRKRMKLTQVQVSRLLGWKNTKGLGLIEAGYSLPTLMTALKLSIIYRVPVEFLFKDSYEKLRRHIRTKEEALVPIGQQRLPFAYDPVRHS